MAKAFVYTELQISASIADAPWKDINTAIKSLPGFINKTWLQGHGTNTLGGFYQFQSIENANQFVTGYFPSEAEKFGVAQMTRVFDADVVADASRDIGSVHFDVAPPQSPGAFVYTELQMGVSFENFPWQDRNTALKNVPGLIAKTWLSGLHTKTLGGFDAFDTLENAQNFAIRQFPKVAASMGTAFITRVFEARVTEDASREMHSPFYV